jgi:hypothetical protein
MWFVSECLTLVSCSRRHESASEVDAGTDTTDVVYCVGEPGPCFCLPKDGAAACRVDDSAGGDCTCGAGAEGAPVDGTDDAPEADITDATGAESASEPFLGTWTLNGTETFVCSTESAQATPIAATVTFGRGAEATDLGEVDLFFNAGLGCSLAMFVTDGVARLVSAPQTCVPAGRPVNREFTSVEVQPSGTSLDLTETFTDPAGCQYEVRGILTR